MQLEQSTVFPVMGKWLTPENSTPLDFSSQNTDLLVLDLHTTSYFNDYVFGYLQQQNKQYGYGGYLENRIIYKRSKHFQKGESRCMHLGMDVWCDAFHPLYAPLDSTVHSFADNDNFGDYGPTIILEHEWNGQTLYTLYGHLSRKSLENIKVGQVIKKGEVFCEVGPYPENGDWPPHLHFQFIADIGNYRGDFPGVCAPSQLDEFKKVCWDPKGFLVLT